MKSCPLLFAVPVAVLSLAVSPPARAQDSATGDDPIKLTDPVAPGSTDRELKIGDATIEDAPPSSGGDSLAQLNALLNEASEAEAKVITALSAADQAKLRELLRDASTFVSGIRIQEAFEKLLEAEDMAPELFTVHNLKGAAYTKMRDFEKARASFEKAVAIAPNAFMGRFNLAETDFVSHDYEAAIKGFSPLIGQLENQARLARESADDPKKPLSNEQRKNLRVQADATDGTVKLIQYKLLISNLKTGNEKAAQEIQQSFNFMDDAPAFYYGHAAIAFEAKDQEEAQRWLRSAENIYDRQQLSIYTDSLIETGWIDNLQ